MVAGPPPSGAPLPGPLASLVAGAPHRAVWCNGAGGWTVAIGDPPTEFLKWTPSDAPVWLAPVDDEVARLRWASAHVTVPEVLDAGGDEAGSWLRTRALPGSSAVEPRWRSDPERAVRAIGVGLRHLHDVAPVDSCPFDWSPATRLVHLHPGSHDGRDALPPMLSAVPPVDRLVVCHGDACAPNTLVDDRGAFVGHVDVGSLGVADRWADLAVASMSLTWNYGPGWEPVFFSAYGVEPDAGRIEWYRRLWDVT